MNNKKNLIPGLSVLLTAAVSLTGCVDNRPVRNGLTDEVQYLTKAELTAANPKEGGSELWLFKTTVVKTSAPNILSDVVFPGLESDLMPVSFRFSERGLQVVDGRALQLDDPDDPNDDLATQTERVVFEFAGQHVDVKLRESLDGERTNFLEENTEKGWAERAKFKVDFEKTSMEPAAGLSWIYGLYATFCAIPQSATLVPGSYEWDADDQYLSFVIDVNYGMNWAGWICSDLFNLYEFDGMSTNIHYRMAFYRPGASTYTKETIAEKAIANKKYGAFQTSNVFRDPVSGLRGNVNYINRWNPDREEPITFYFHEGFPEKFKSMFENIADRTNKVFADAGSTLTVQFLEHDYDGVERNFGDPRYSFAVWHQGIDQTSGLLGYGPSSAIPWSGEIISANLNLYNVGLDRYRYYIQNYLEEHGGLLKPEPDTAWEDIECAAGATSAPGDPVRCGLIAEGEFNSCMDNGEADCAAVRTQVKQECEQSPRLTSQLFNEMRFVMELEDNADGSADDFIPTPDRASFRDDYHRILPEMRYAYPAWNRYVYRTAEAPAQQLRAMQETDHEFQKQMQAITMGENPFGAQALSSQAGIEAQMNFAGKMRGWRANHEEFQSLREHLLATRNVYTVDPNDAINAIALSARRCTDAGTWESDATYLARLETAVMYDVAIHEFGHNLSLRHNFYGSVDGKHMKAGEVSASVMDYVSSWEQAGGVEDCDTGKCDGDWGEYDKMALQWIYGSEDKKAEAMAKDLLYCTDEHRILSPLCRAHDLGITPAQITLNAIERYDWLYTLRNRRAFRTFWDTSSYTASVYASIFDIQRTWHMALFDWGGGGVQETLKRLDQVNGDRVLTNQEYDEISIDFYNDVSASVGMMIGFYDAVINQSASFRNYQTEFDPFYGDILRIGIIVDKLFTTFAFMDLQDVYYSPNVATYVAVWDAPFGTQNSALAQRVLDNMLGSNYDTFPWFKYYAVGLFASATNSNLVGGVQAKERIAMWRFQDLSSLYERFPQENIDLATRPDNPQQTFVQDGEQYVYSYLPDRAWHLVASKSRSPVSYQFVRDYNEDLNASAAPDLDNYGLKILLAYYEFYNNFVGF